MGLIPFLSPISIVKQKSDQNLNSSPWAVFTLRESSPVTLEVSETSTRSAPSSNSRVSTTRKTLLSTSANESLTSTRLRPRPELPVLPPTEPESSGARSADLTVTLDPSERSSPRTFHPELWATESELCFTHQASKSLLPLYNILRK